MRRRRAGRRRPGDHGILLDYLDAGQPVAVMRRAAYVFRQEADGKWLCLVDNSCAADLLGVPA